MCASGVKPVMLWQLAAHNSLEQYIICWLSGTGLGHLVSLAQEPPEISCHTIRPHPHLPKGMYSRLPIHSKLQLVQKDQHAHKWTLAIHKMGLASWTRFPTFYILVVNYHISDNGKNDHPAEQEQGN
jgi:hypothetical protein